MNDEISAANAIFRNFHLITMRDDGSPYGLVETGALAVCDGLISWIGADSEVGEVGKTTQVIDGRGRYLSPGLIDCHTHVIWGGSRAEEWERRLAGSSYEQIAREGGGIRSTVRATREADEEVLFYTAHQRIGYLIEQGVTTVEVKSGYGLDTRTEQKMLRVAHQLRLQIPVNISITFLGAHAVPPEFDGRADQYVDLVCQEMIPAVCRDCQAVDVFCEAIAFDLAQTERVFRAAVDHELAIKVHAEQLSHTGAARLAADMGGWSADHLEYLDREGVRAMAASGTVAVLLPGAFYFINETQRPPIDWFRAEGVPMAVATDMNPGSSPLASPTVTMNLACTLFGLTPAEALAGMTRHAARALRMDDLIGTLEVGKRADLADWNVGQPAEIVYGLGHNPCVNVYTNGELIHEGFL